MENTEEIIHLITEYSGQNNISKNTDIFLELGITGDDFDELMVKFSKRFNVDMSNYLWYFHNEEEGQNIGACFFKPPHQIVNRIPITPKLLDCISKSGEWNVDYPEHKLPKYRKDLFFNYALLISFIIWITYKLTNWIIE